MSQRNSGHKRRRHDLYQTPYWVVLEGLAPHIDLRGRRIWDPCCGPGKMLAAAKLAGAERIGGSDIRRWKSKTLAVIPFLQLDFTEVDACLALPHWSDTLLINPPYGVGGELAEDFLDMALAWLQEHEACDGEPRMFAILLPVDFDAAATRGRFFEDCPFFTHQITLRRRISWFKPIGAARPSTNHAWFVYRIGGPALGDRAVKLYAPVVGNKWP